VRPRRQSDAGARPFNFTVRSHLGTSGFAKKMGKPPSFGSAVTSAAADLIVLPVSMFSATGCACGCRELRLRSGRAPRSGLLSSSRAWFAARQARIAFVSRSGARLTGRLYRVGLRQSGRTRTVVICGVTSNNRWSGRRPVEPVGESVCRCLWIKRLRLAAPMPRAAQLHR